jgi:hypothetical protein
VECHLRHARAVSCLFRHIHGSEHG